MAHPLAQIHERGPRPGAPSAFPLRTPRRTPGARVPGNATGGPRSRQRTAPPACGHFCAAAVHSGTDACGRHGRAGGRGCALPARQAGHAGPDLRRAESHAVDDEKFFAGAPYLVPMERTPTGEAAAPAVEVRRSHRRKRTVSAYRDGDRVVVLIPARLSRDEERRWVATMLERVQRREQRRSGNDEALAARAAELSSRYLDGRARATSVRWVANQEARWGSCTPLDGSVRLSIRLQQMPGWVVDYVLLHELAHLLEADHSTAFWALLDRYPRTERARGYLDGVAHAAAAAGTERVTSA